MVQIPRPSRDGNVGKWGADPIPKRVAERAATRFSMSEDGCHISTYSVASHGYAQIGWIHEGKACGTTAHRAAWVYAHKTQIPEGSTVDHTCKKRRCVNPEHLRLLGNFENARRTSGRDWELGECINGHPNSELYWDGTRHRCLPCAREYQARYRRKYPDRRREIQRRYRVKKASARKGITAGGNGTRSHSN